jgi:hypothetical protein
MLPGTSIHGVKAVVKGQRCALAMWYTMDLSHKELARLSIGGNLGGDTIFIISNDSK